MLELKVSSSLGFNSGAISSNLLLLSLNFGFPGTKHISKGLTVGGEGISGMLVLGDGGVKLSVSGVTVINQSLKVMDISVEFGIEALVFLDGIREFFNLAIFFLELGCIGVDILFLSFKPSFFVGDGLTVLGNCGITSSNSIFQIGNFSILSHDHSI